MPAALKVVSIARARTKLKRRKIKQLKATVVHIEDLIGECDKWMHTMIWELDALATRVEDFIQDEREA
jgi:hypothetical protein